MSQGPDQCCTGRKITVVVIGSNEARKVFIANQILETNVFTETPRSCVSEQNDFFLVIKTPDLFDEELPHREQLISQCKEPLHLGNQRFLLVLPNEEITMTAFLMQIKKTQEMFGEQITTNLSVLLAGTTSPWKVDCEISVSADLGRLKNTWSNSPATSALKKFQNEMQRWKSGAEGWFSGAENDKKGLNIVLLGQTGTGKSASGNTILGKDSFKSKTSSMPITTECKSKEFTKYGTKVKVIDTPDFFDENVDEKHLPLCRELCQPWPSVYLLVLQVGRFTDGEREILDKLERAFESTIRERMLVLFTHGEKLEQSALSPEQFISEADPHLQLLIKLCEDRYHVFTNKSDNQLKSLFEKIRRIPGHSQCFPRLTESTKKKEGGSDVV